MFLIVRQLAKCVKKTQRKHIQQEKNGSNILVEIELQYFYILETTVSVKSNELR